MSFFGFDTSLPRDKAGGAGKGIFEHTNPFNEVARARKLQAFQDNEDEMYVAHAAFGNGRLLILLFQSRLRRHLRRTRRPA